MNLTISITDGPLGPAPAWQPDRAGAILAFEGIVRAKEDEGTISALDYQTYEPMAQRMLEEIARDLIQRHGLIAMHIHHSRGQVPVGQCSFRLLIASLHRKEAIAGMDEFIDRLKRDVPIWKKAVWLESGAAKA
jgi:molybdopterin synthase catalytic subunit